MTLTCPYSMNDINFRGFTAVDDLFCAARISTKIKQDTRTEWSERSALTICFAQLLW